MVTRIKFCGCTSVQDAELAVAAGADAIGVIFAEESPRFVPMDVAREIALAVPAMVSLVGVFVDPPEPLLREGLKAGFTPQFSGNEDAASCEAFAAGPYLKAFHLPPDGGVDVADFEAVAAEYTHATWLFDTAVAGKRGGTGTTFDWDLAPRLANGRRFVMSGGLTPENVGDCVRRTRPFAVDVRSGIESGGVKDFDKMRAFVRAVKEADAEA
jgi:phosphoribosylanthranilate isomerase